MTEDRPRYLRWACKHCGSEQVSDRWMRWHMDYCKCGKTAVDAEEYYDRYVGNPAEIVIIKEWGGFIDDE